MALVFLFLSMNSKCLMICRTASARFVFLTFQFFGIADTKAEYSVPIFIRIVA